MPSPTKQKPGRVGVYVILAAERQYPPAYQLPEGYPPLQPVGAFLQQPAGAAKGALVHSEVNGPVEDIYTCHFVAMATVEYPNGEAELTLEPEAREIIDMISKGLNAVRLGRDLVENTLKSVAEVVANESQAAALAWIADQRRKTARH